VASVLGIVVLGETLNADGVDMIALVSAAAVVIVAIVALARGEADTAALHNEQNAETTDQARVSETLPQSHVTLGPRSHRHLLLASAAAPAA
jgi:peroxiredoxin